MKQKSRARTPRTAPPPAGRRRFGLWWLLAAAFVVKLIVLLQLHDHPLLRPRSGLDSGIYLDLARRVAAGDLLSGARVFFVSPLYIYFLAGVLAVSSSVLVAQIVQIALGALTVWLVASIARDWYGDAGGWVAGSLAALTGYFTFNEVLTIQSAIDPALTAGGLWLLVRAWSAPSTGSEPRRTWMFACAGLVLGLHILNRPNIAAWAAAAIMLTLRHAHDSRDGAARSLAMAAGLLVAIAPVTIRNYAVSGEFALVSSHGGLNFYLGNHEGATGTYQVLPGITPSIEGQDKDAREVAARALGHPVTDAQASSWFYAQARSWMTSHPIDAVRLFAKKILYVVNATDVALNDSYAFFSRDERTLLSVLVAGPWLILPLGLAGLWFGAPRQRKVWCERGPTAPPTPAWWLVCVFVPVYAVSVAVFFVAGRYRLPVLVALCLPATGALLALVREWRERRYRRLGTHLAALAVLGVVVNLNLGLDDGRGGWRAEMIVTAIEQHEDARAEALLAATEPTFPQRARLLDSVANAYVSRGDPSRGVMYLERALAIEPTRLSLRVDLVRALVAAGRGDEAIAAIRAVPAADTIDEATQLMFGRWALQLGDAGIAEPFLARAAAARPDDASVHQSHAMALGQLGRTDQAIAEFEAGGEAAAGRRGLAPQPGGGLRGGAPVCGRAP